MDANLDINPGKEMPSRSCIVTPFRATRPVRAAVIRSGGRKAR